MTHDQPLTTGELDDLARALDHITTDLIDRLAIAATDPWARSPVTGPHVQTQPCSRPPFAVSAEVTLSALRETLSVTVRAISEHRHTPLPDVATVVQAAAWVRKHRVALSTMIDGRQLVEQLHRAATVAWRSTASSNDDSTLHMTDAMRRDANRHIVTAPQVEQFARRFGLAADGLTEHRVTNLRRRHGLTGTQDPDTRTWFYRLGDVIAAHEAAIEARDRRRGA